LSASYISGGTTNISANATTSSFMKSFIKLLPGVSYDYRVIIVRTSSNLELFDKVTTIKQRSAAGAAFLSAKTETSIRLNVGSLYPKPGYDRELHWYFRLHNATKPAAWSVPTISKGITTIHIADVPVSAYTFTGLTVGKSYDFLCKVMAQGVSICSLGFNDILMAETFNNLPVPHIIGMVQPPYTNLIRMYWFADYPSPNTRFQTYIQGTPDVAVGSLMTGLPGQYTEFEALVTGTNVFKIVATHLSVPGSAVSEAYSFNIQESVFAFDINYIPGSAIITAGEWNRFLSWAYAKLVADQTVFAEEQEDAFAMILIKGDVVTSEHFNIIKNALGSAMPDKEDGEPLLASDYNQLETDLNAIVI